MTQAALVLLCLAGVAAVVDWVAVARDDKRLEYVAKPLAMALLVAMALTLDPADESRRTWFVAAGVFSLAGDVFLMLPRDRFVPGLVSFLLAHLCYVAGLVQGTAQPAMAAAGIAVVVVAVVVVARRVVQAVRTGPNRALVVPVIVYICVIAAMVVAAFAYGPAVAIAGAVLFFASDSVLAWRRFVGPVPSGGVIVMVTYHLGQAALLLSVAQP